MKPGTTPPSDGKTELVWKEATIRRMKDLPNILVVEDDKSTRIVLTALLEDSMYRVSAAESAEGALGHLVAADPVDVVVSDLRLPDGSGLQILWALKKINPDAAFILITAHASVETAIAALNEGAFAYHVKPLDMDALSNSIRNALRNRRLSIECRTLLEKVQEYNVELAGKNQELKWASDIVSHELKTPLTSILGHAERMLLQPQRVGPLNPRQQKYLEAIHQDALRLGELIDGLLDVSRIDSGGLLLDSGEVAVRGVAQAVLLSMRDQIAEKGINAVLHIPAELPTVRADRLRFTQVLANLVSNACKYSRRDGTVTVTAKASDGTVQIEVSDTGAGISRADQARLFAKFFRADNSATRGSPGAGLGLFIARHIVEAHGGTIWVDSEEGKGSTFGFTFPAYDPRPAPLPGAAASPCSGPLGGPPARTQGQETPSHWADDAMGVDPKERFR
jgi:signal transduction histidine kinase